MSDEGTREREITALEKLDAQVGLNRMEIITLDEKGSHQLPNGKVIDIIPAYEWLTR